MARTSANTDSKKSDPNSLLLRAVENGLKRYGESVAQVVFFRLEHTNNLPKEEIPKRLDNFVAAVEEMFGSGVKSVSKSIITELKVSTGGFVVFDEDDLASSLRLARAYFQKTET